MPRDLPTVDVERWFNALLATEGPSLMRLAASYAGTSGDRDDLFQEIATAVWRALPGFRGECSDRTVSVVFYAALLTFDLAWIYGASPERTGAGLWAFLTSASVIVVWVVTGGLGLAAAWHRRRIRAELGNLLGLRRQIEDLSADQA